MHNNDCVKVNVHVVVFTFLFTCTHVIMYMHIYLQLDTYVHHKADFQGVVRHTKNAVKQIVKVNYQDWVSEEDSVCMVS